MSRSAATELAQSSTIHAIAGDLDLEPLQDVIATEKLILRSYVPAATPTALCLISSSQCTET